MKHGIGRGFCCLLLLLFALGSPSPQEPASLETAAGSAPHLLEGWTIETDRPEEFVIGVAQ